MPDHEEVPLAGGNVNPGAVVRVGDTVRRPCEVGAHTVHGILRHFESVGFERAPRFLGIDEQGREVLTFIPGVNVWDSQHNLVQTMDGIRRLGVLARDVHDALSTYTPPADAVWNNVLRDSHADGHLIHGDLAPWNMVAEPESDTCFVIDWDTAAPGRLEWELAYTLQTAAFLWGDPPPWKTEPYTAAETVDRVKAFAEGYRMDDGLLVRSLETSVERSQAMADFIERCAADGRPAFQKMLAEGHAEAWAGGAQSIERNLPVWLSML